MNRNKKNRIKKNRIKKNIALITAGLSVLFIVTGYIILINKSNNSTLYLKDITGSREALKGIVLNGCVEDKSHGQIFSIDDGNLSYQFLYYDHIRDMFKNQEIKQYYRGNTIVHNKARYYYNYDYKIAPDGNTVVDCYDKDMKDDNGKLIKDIVERTIKTSTDKVNIHLNARFDFINGRNNYSYDNHLDIDTGVSIESYSKDFLFEKRQVYSRGESGNLENLQSEQPNTYRRLEGGVAIRITNPAIAFVNDKLYFTVPTRQYSYSQGRFVGENGIFEVKKFGEWWNEDDKTGKAVKIAKWDQTSKSRTLGLHSVNNRLVVVMLLEDTLTVRAYNPENGSLIDEETFPHIKINNDEFTYNTFIHDSAICLELLQNKQERQVVTLEIGTTIEIMPLISVNNLQGLSLYKIMEVKPVDNKIFVLSVLNDVKENVPNKMFLSKHYIISIYDREEKLGKLLYQGEIVTDVNDDNQKYIKQMNLTGSAGYSIEDIRDLVVLDVKEKTYD